MRKIIREECAEERKMRQAYNFDLMRKYGGQVFQVGLGAFAACERAGKNPHPLLTDAGPGYFDRLARTLPGEDDNQIVLRETEILKPHRVINVPEQAGPINLAEAFQTRDGLFVDPDFCEKILSMYRRVVERMPLVQYGTYDLKVHALDTKIREHLPSNHLAHPAHIWAFTEAQRGGKEGILLNDGRANLFYVLGVFREVFVVSVRWFSVRLSHMWLVRTWRLNELAKWDSGSRVFSCNGSLVI